MVRTIMRPICHRLLALLGSLLVSTLVAHAGVGGFASTLTTEQQAAAGLAVLSPVERVVLDQLVAGELTQLRSGDITEFAGSFVGRRTETERKAAGLDRLTEEHLTKLNEYVASTLTARPKPKERPRLKENDVLAAGRRPQVHGSVSVTYGWSGRGRDMWAESLWLDYYDPESRVGIGIGISNYSGNGFYGYYPDYYGYGGYGGRYFYDDMPVYATAPVFVAASYRGSSPRDDFSFGQGQSFCAGGGGYAMGHGGGRRH